VCFNPIYLEKNREEGREENQGRFFIERKKMVSGGSLKD